MSPAEEAQPGAPSLTSSCFARSVSGRTERMSCSAVVALPEPASAAIRLRSSSRRTRECLTRCARRRRFLAGTRLPRKSLSSRSARIDAFAARSISLSDRRTSLGGRACSQVALSRSAHACSSAVGRWRACVASACSFLATACSRMRAMLRADALGFVRCDSAAAGARTKWTTTTTTPMESTAMTMARTRVLYRRCGTLP